MKQRVALLAALLAGCAGAPQEPVPVNAQPSGYVLRVAEGNAVPFRGVVDYDAAGVASTAMLYGPGPAAALGGLIAHAAILSSTRENQKAEIQKQADQVLAPYAPILSTFLQKELVDGTLAAATLAIRRPVAGDAPASLILASAPVFSMTQDQTAIVLEHAIVIQSDGETVYRNTVHMVSTPHGEADPQAWWGDNAGERLKHQSVTMYRDSLELALREAAKKSWTGLTPQKTVRYREGRVERIERAEVLEPQCDRAVIRTLRGWLMSVPLSDPSGPCVVDVAE